MRKLFIALAALALSACSPVHAADVSFPAKAQNAAPLPCQSSQNCSGWYVDFGLLNQNANLISSGLAGVNNDVGLIGGGGYQLWQGSLLAGIQGNAGYEFTGQGVSGSGSKFVGTIMAQLGYNFFTGSPATAAVTSPGQSPFSQFVPVNILAASTPFLEAGGCIRHGIVEGCAGAGVQTVIAQGWSTAFHYDNMPSQKGQPDTQVFRLEVLKHF